MGIVLLLPKAEDILLLGNEDWLCDTAAAVVERVAFTTPALGGEVG